MLSQKTNLFLMLDDHNIILISLASYIFVFEIEHSFSLFDLKIGEDRKKEEEIRKRKR